MRYTWILLAAPLMAGCYQKERQAAKDTIVAQQTKIAQLETVSAQKDTLMMEFSAAQQFIENINTEISKLRKAATPKPGPAGDIPAQTDQEKRESLLARVKSINTALIQTDARLKQTLARVDSLAKDNAGLREQLSSFEQMVASLRGVVDQQKNDLVAFADTVTTLKAQTTRLASEKSVLTDTVSAMTTRENTVYYIVGTKKDLIDQGLITETGGSRVLLVARVGKTLAPARTLDPTKFTAIDRRTQTTIDLPDDAKAYRLVSLQNPMYLDTPPDKDGKYHDKLVIRDPASFWAASKYLIVVVD